MVRQQRIRRRVDPAAPDGDRPDRLPRRPLTDTNGAAQLLERIRRLLADNRSAR
jgi:hypothetical protein